MNNLIASNNAADFGKFPNFFKARDIFLHDGSSLRRVRVGANVQLAAAIVILLTIFWSVFAAAQLVGGTAAPASNAEVARMEQQVKAMQADVQALRQVAERRFQITEREIRSLGIDPRRLRGVGGPMEPVEPVDSLNTTAADPNFRALFMSWKQLDQIEQGSIAIPSTQPVRGSALTSGFGVRSDPFRGRAAMHGGIDLAGPVGTPIYATADGIVGRSEYNNGGYGNLVEIDHGRGIQTRYGHLSRSMVRPGQKVKRGDVIALMGSTGRSTGSHLHYEVRIDGRAVNPVPFMQSSEYLQSVQRRAAAATQVAIGGPEAKGTN